MKKSEILEMICIEAFCLAAAGVAGYKAALMFLYHMDVQFALPQALGFVFGALCFTAFGIGTIISYRRHAAKGHNPTKEQGHENAQ